MFWASGVSAMCPPVAGTRLMQTRTFTGSGFHPRVLGIEDRRRADDRDSGGVLLAEILDTEFSANLGMLGRQIAHQDRLADRRPRSRAGDVRPAAVPVDERPAVRRHDRLAPLRVSLESRLRHVVVDRQGAEGGRGRLRPLLAIRLLSDEVLLLDLRPGQPALDQVELLLQFVAVGPIALLEPAGRGVDANPDRGNAVPLAGVPELVPDPGALLEGHVNLPAELAHVG